MPKAFEPKNLETNLNSVFIRHVEYSDKNMLTNES